MTTRDRIPDKSTSAARMDAGALARWLLDEHRAGRPFVPFSDRTADASLAGAYAVQREYVNGWRKARGVGLAGWKIGLTSPTMQQLCGIDSPVAGAVLDDLLLESGVPVRRAGHGRLGVEFEIAVRLGRGLPPGSVPTREMVVAAVDAVAPAIELVDDRGCDYAALDAFSLVADNAWNAGIVLGAWRSDWPALDTVEGAVFQDGVEVARGSGRDVLGHPFDALWWLARHLAAQGESLKAGQIVMTGSLVRTRFPEEAQTLRYEADGLGAVELSVA